MAVFSEFYLFRFPLLFSLAGILALGDAWRKSGVCPKNGACDELPMPTTISEFVKLAHERGIDWELDEIVEMEGA